MDVLKALGGEAGVVIGGGHLGADGEQHHGVALSGLTGKILLKVRQIHGRGLGELPRLLVVGVNEIGVNIHAVGVLLLSQGHAQREDADAVFPNQLGGQVAGAVGRDHSSLTHGFLRSAKGASFPSIGMVHCIIRI